MILPAEEAIELYNQCQKSSRIPTFTNSTVSFPLNVDTSPCTLSFPLRIEKGTISSWAVLWPTRSKMSRSFTTTWPFRRTSNTCSDHQIWRSIAIHHPTCLIHVQHFSKIFELLRFYAVYIVRVDIPHWWLILTLLITIMQHCAAFMTIYPAALPPYLLLWLCEVNLCILHNQYIIALIADGNIVTKSVLIVALCLVQDLVLWTGTQDWQTHTVIRCFKEEEQHVQLYRLILPQKCALP